MALVEPLTAREIELLRLVTKGQNNPEIARSLVVSRTTVKTHVQNIIRKLNASDRIQSAIRAIELGIVQTDLERSLIR